MAIFLLLEMVLLVVFPPAGIALIVVTMFLPGPTAAEPKRPGVPPEERAAEGVPPKEHRFPMFNLADTEA